MRWMSYKCSRIFLYASGSSRVSGGGEGGEAERRRGRGRSKEGPQRESNPRKVFAVLRKNHFGPDWPYFRLFRLQKPARGWGGDMGGRVRVWFLASNFIRALRISADEARFAPPPGPRPRYAGAPSSGLPPRLTAEQSSINKQHVSHGNDCLPRFPTRFSIFDLFSGFRALSRVAIIKATPTAKEIIAISPQSCSASRNFLTSTLWFSLRLCGFLHTIRNCYKNTHTHTHIRFLEYFFFKQQSQSIRNQP